jgi:hypothetical protein
MTRISHRMQKHKFDITCLDMLFMETAPVPPPPRAPEQEK